MRVMNALNLAPAIVMSDDEDEVGDSKEEEQVERGSASRRSSFVERKRQIKEEAGDEDEYVDDCEEYNIDTAVVGASNNQEANSENAGEEISTGEPSASHHEADLENDAALYDEVDQDWNETIQKPASSPEPSRSAETESPADIPEDISAAAADTVADFPPPVEVEEMIEEPSFQENETAEPRSDFEYTEVTDNVEQRSPATSERRQHPDADASSSAEKKRQMSVLEERAALKLQQVEAAEELAMAAEKAKSARKEAMRQREAKRHEDFVNGNKKVEEHASSGEGERNESEDMAASKHKQFLPHIPKRARAAAAKDKERGKEESDHDASPAGDHRSSHRDAAVLEDPTKEQKALRSKGLVSRVRRNKMATAAGDDSSKDVNGAEDTSDKKGQLLEGVGIEGSSLSRNSSQALHGPKPPRRKAGGVVGRPGLGRRIASSTTDDTDSLNAESRSGDGTHLPPLVHPRSSPDPSQFGDAEGMSSTENGDNSQKGRKHRKPLFLRMIERAQQQTLEDEKQKHEQYVQQKKIRQKNNPSAEELREHRQKHDELMRAKHDEARRNMAEAAAANAKAVPVKKAAPASAVVAEAPEGAPSSLHNQRDPSTEGAAGPLKKKKKKVTNHAGSGIASRHDVHGDVSLSAEAAGGAEVAGMHKSGSSPAKIARNGAESPLPHSTNHKTSGKKENSNRKAVSGSLLRSSPDAHETELQSSPVRKLNFDVAAASKAVALLPELTVESVAVFCSPDWMAAFARIDLDEVNNDRETGAEPSSNFASFLQPAPPNADAYKLMYGNGV